jgi:hypothetical protein
MVDNVHNSKIMLKIIRFITPNSLIISNTTNIIRKKMAKLNLSRLIYNNI